MFYDKSILILFKGNKVDFYQMINIGILRETKLPPDPRVAITPGGCHSLLKKYPGLNICVQTSPNRCFDDKEYQKAGAIITEKPDNCEILTGIKELDIKTIIPGKTYLFFAHVGKKQPHNRKLLQALKKNKATLIDYEYITDETGNRLIAFGKWAGRVGGYNAVRMMCKKFSDKDLPSATELKDYLTLRQYLETIKIHPVKILLTGGGRVASGIVDILNILNIQKTSPKDFLHQKYDYPVFCQIDIREYFEHKDSGGFHENDFFKHPADYLNQFKKYVSKTDVYIAGHYWNPLSPAFFSSEDMQKQDFRIKIISDISCDVPGPIPSTTRTSTTERPFYDINPRTLQEEAPFSDEKNITVSAVDNLPCELPVDASENFSKIMVEKIVPEILNENSPIIDHATILKNGQLTKKFSYLKNYAEGNE